MKYKTVALFFLALIPSLSFGALTPEQASAKSHGLELYNQNQWFKLEPYLKVSAEAGDIESQYYLAEALRHQKLFMTKDAQYWYEKAASKGHVYSMLRLGENKEICTLTDECKQDEKYWINTARKTAKECADAGEKKCLLMMYNATADVEWLKKSAEAGTPLAQSLLAHRFEEGEGWFLFPSQRKEAVMKLAKASSDGGYPPAMFEWAMELAKQGQPEAARETLINSAKTGYVDAVFEYAAALSSEDHGKKYGVEVDKSKSYALFSLLSELGDSSPGDLAQKQLPALASSMSNKEIDQAKKITKDWKSSNPPLSYFTPEFGF
ncbi:tetratricopeptide repeat protein [Pseudomonas putida]|uniref:Sel1 repeat family protein n=1 Tax=Pseudomonas putida TaxID=303 RepID=A0A2C5W0W4_PSEPU|nr:sel1 repeat family protein [Pseudomonas putida]PHH39087.1 hypothetical protein CRX57_02530 [Pseudomonas putida]